MKILMIAPEPFLQPRGTPLSVYQRLLALSSLGYQVDLLTYHLGEVVDIPGVVVHRIPAIPFIKDIKPGPSWAKLVLDPLIFIYALYRLMTNHYDVLHTHEEASFFAMPLARGFRVKHLYDMHSSLPQQLRSFDNWNKAPLIRLANRIEKMVIRSADAIITIGADLEKLVKQQRPDANTIMIENLPIQEIVEPPNPVEIARIAEKLKLNGSPKVVYTGTFEPYQGLDMFIESAEIIVNEYPEVTFLLVGGNTNQITHYQKLVAEKNLNNHFHFTGNVSAAEAAAYLELAAVVVSPRLEGTSIPLKLYTYLQSNKPLVATKIEAHQMALNEDLAVLVAPNAEDFAQGILKLIYNPQLGLRLAKKAREFMWSKSGFGVYQKKVESIYQALMPPD